MVDSYSNIYNLAPFLLILYNSNFVLLVLFSSGAGRLTESRVLLMLNTDSTRLHLPFC